MHELGKLHQLIVDILAVESPTYHEEKLCAFIKKRLDLLKPTQCIKDNDGVAASFIRNRNNPTLAFVGHTDVVPAHFTPYCDDQRIHGSGASDMKSGLASLLFFTEHYIEELLCQFNIVFIAYNREERTSLRENGLYTLLKTHNDMFKNVDCAIVAEPTDNTIQLGCLGSLHINVRVFGKEAHSARPWNGENALYKSLPLIKCIQHKKTEDVIINNLVYKEVISITECKASDGRTSVPGIIDFNINYRFSPKKTEKQAQESLIELIQNVNINPIDITIVDSVPSGRLIESELSSELITLLGCSIEAKQAWTDVAQLANAGIACFNFGPGNQDQAHKDNEYISIDNINHYFNHLKKILNRRK